jgi:hypothetical protein
MVTPKDDEFESKYKTQQFAQILLEKDGVPGSMSRRTLERIARRSQACRNPVTDPVTGKKRKLPWCRSRLCPNCEARKAKANCRVLFDQFEEHIGSGRLYEFRMDLDCGNVRGGLALKRMIAVAMGCWTKLSRSSAWNDVIVKAGAVVHVTWKSSTSEHQAGYWVHVHAIVLTSTSRPRFGPIFDEYRNILGAFAVSSGSRRDAISSRIVGDLAKAVGYFTHVRKRICGYPDKDSDRWLLREIPDEEILAYLGATRRRLSVFHRGFDPDVLKISRRRRQRLAPEEQVAEPVNPSQGQMVSVYSLLSRQNHPRLTIRFNNLATYVDKCKSESPCRLRACPRCLQRRLQHECDTIIAGASTHRGATLVAMRMRVPGLFGAEEVEAAARSVHGAITSFLRNGSVWPHAPSTFVLRVRARPAFGGGRTRFRLRVQLIVAVTGGLDESNLRERWQRQLQVVGLRCRAKAAKPLVVVEVVTDLPRKARKICGRVDSILGPVGKMNPEEASAYLHVLATHSDLVISKVWEL